VLNYYSGVQGTTTAMDRADVAIGAACNMTSRTKYPAALAKNCSFSVTVMASGECAVLHAINSAVECFSTRHTCRQPKRARSGKAS
jgi:hypothetical protein